MSANTAHIHELALETGEMELAIERMGHASQAPKDEVKVGSF